LRKIKDLAEHSYYIGKLPAGCKLCGPGKKMVLLITGKCGCRCFYCPLSFKKRGKDVIYANELKVKQLDEILEEAFAISAGGTGITGGDPLYKPELTVRAISMLKSAFGEDHHIHLYTAGKFDPKYINDLVSAGLNEIRFHPPLATWKKLNNDFKCVLKTAMDTDLSVGSEIPVIPGFKDSTLKYARTLNVMGLEFLNLNELEFSESNWQNLRKRGFVQKNEIANTVKGSEELAIDILQELANDPDFDMDVHYCSANFKDKQQLTNRLKRRAKNVMLPHYIKTDDGTFLIGIIEAGNYDTPINLIKIREILKLDFGVPEKLMRLDKEANRLEVAPWVLEQLKNEFGEEIKKRSFIIEEYPTADRLEVERIPIDKL
jgi:pyruvate formate-lyase activating enzyme-like uncharacterized protein